MADFGTAFLRFLFLPADIPVTQLKLDVTKHTGRGLLSKVTTIQRLNTHGGALSGGCDKAGDFKSVAYTATYVVLQKAK